MEPVEAYALDVKSGKIPAGTLHRQACVRHLEDMERAEVASWPYKFRPELAAQAVAFFADLQHYKGEWVGTPIILEPWQVFVVGNIFGWVRKKGGGKLRRFRRVYIEVPRKNGKTLIAAGIGVYVTFFDGEAGAEGYVAATTRQQAMIVFEDARQIVLRSGLRDLIKVLKRNLHQESTTSKLVPVASDYDTLDGLNIHACVLDEYHQQPDRGMVSVMETGMGARRQPLMILVTTAGNDPLSPCGEERQYSEKILARSLENESFFAFVSHADEGDDPFAEATHRKANPNYGVSVKPDDMEALALVARHVPSKLNDFKQLRLNIWVNTSSPWLDLEAWKRGQTEWTDETWAALEGRQCWGGIDLSSRLDLTAFVLVFPPRDDDPKWRIIPRFLTPEEGLGERERKARAPYQQWVDDGHLDTNSGSRIAQSVVRQWVTDARERYELQGVGVDPFNGENLLEQINEDWGELDRAVAIDQTFRVMSDPAKELEAEIVGARVDCGGHPVMTWMAANVVVKTDDKENIRPTKDPKKMRGRIDGIVATICAMRLAVRYDDDDAYGDGHELLVLDTPW